MRSFREVVLVDAGRTAVGKRNGTLASVHANELLGTVMAGVVQRAGLDPDRVDQVVGGCVQQIGAQSANVTRNAWLTAGLPVSVPATTVNSQCGSSQQALTMAHALIGSGLADIVLSCGVETMSSIPMGSLVTDPKLGAPRAGTYADRYERTTQFEGADRIGRAWNITRADTEAFSLSSQERAGRAWREGRFAAQIMPIEVRDSDGSVTKFERDECPRQTSLEALAGLTTNLPEPGALHTPGTSSQISDGASAVLLASAETAEKFGLHPRARLVDSVLVGSDPVLMLTGPIPATQALLERNHLTMDDIDLFEVNEAFASVALAWAKELNADPERVNPNGGAIALGHPLGATGGILVTKALYELERSGSRRALVTMCCGGGLGTGTVLERL